jgi:GNAT superfamily N-acetyltransferase
VGYQPPQRYEPTQHDVSDFTSGIDALDRYVPRIAAQAQSSGGASVYVVTTHDRRTVVAYYTLSAGSVAYTDAPARAGRGVPPRPIPVVVLGRLAVDDRHQHSGLGRALLRDSMLRVLTAAEHVDVRALLVHAKDDDVRDWYLKQAEFKAFPGDPASLVLLMKDLRRSVG